jgi:hypothetical protein
MRVLGMIAPHPLGKLGVERVGEIGDVAQGCGLAGAFGEGVLLGAGRRRRRDR